MSISSIETVLQQMRVLAQASGPTTTAGSEVAGGGFAGELKKSLDRISDTQQHGGDIGVDISTRDFWEQLRNNPNGFDAGAPLTRDQNSSINTFWQANKDDPTAVMKAMTGYGVNANAFAVATKQSIDAVGNYLTSNSAPAGFAGWTKPPDAQAAGISAGVAEDFMTPAQKKYWGFTDNPHDGVVNTGPTVIGGSTPGDATYPG